MRTTKSGIHHHVIHVLAKHGSEVTNGAAIMLILDWLKEALRGMLDIIMHSAFVGVIGAAGLLIGTHVIVCLFAGGEE